MSTNLYWKPVYKSANDLSNELKYSLRNKYDGSVNVTMNSTDIPYLTGLLHGGIKDAQLLIDAIEVHDEVDVFES